MSSLLRTIDKVKPVYDRTYEFVLFLCKMLLTVDILITCMAVAGRYVPFVPDPVWNGEIVLTHMAYMTVPSATLAIRRNVHIRMTVLDIYLPKTVARALDILSGMAVPTLAVIVITVDWRYANDIGSKGTYVSIPQLSRFWMYFPAPLARVTMVIFELGAPYNHVKAIRMRKEE